MEQKEIYGFLSRFADVAVGKVAGLGRSLYFFGEVVALIFKGKVRFGEVVKQVYEQGMQSVVVVALTSASTGIVLALQGYVMLDRFGAREKVAALVALSLVRELSPVFCALIFSGKAGSRLTAELGAMSINNQIVATKVMGVDPMEFLVVPRMLGCLLVLPILVVFSEVIGIMGGYLIAVFEADIPGSYYINQTLLSLNYVDFFSGFLKTIFFSVLIGWVCCYQGFYATGGSLGVGRYTTRAVALAYIFVIVSNMVLTKVILTFWG